MMDKDNNHKTVVKLRISYWLLKHDDAYQCHKVTIRWRLSGKKTNNMALYKLLAKSQNVQNVEMATSRPSNCVGTKYWTWMGGSNA